MIVAVNMLSNPTQTELGPKQSEMAPLWQIIKNEHGNDYELDILSQIKSCSGLAQAKTAWNWT